MTDTMEQQLREGLARLRDATASQPFDPYEDLTRGHAAARRARSRSLAGATASVAAVAVAAALWAQGAGAPTPAPAGPATSSVAAGVRTPARPLTTPTPPPSSSPTAPLTSGQLGSRMVATVRAHASGADRYLGGWGDESSGSGIRSSSDSQGLGRFGITVSWGRAGSTSLGGVQVGSTTAHFARAEGQAEALRCNGEFIGPASSTCRLVRHGEDGSRLYYGATRSTRAASYTYPDGRLAYVSVTTRQRGNSLTDTTAPLPSKAEMIAIVTDPRLVWEGPLVSSSFYEPTGRPGWPHASAGATS